MEQKHQRSNHGEEGAILLLVAFASVALLAMGALAVDVGHAYDVRNQLSMSADAAAKAGAYEIYRGNPIVTAYQAFANRVVSEDIAAGRIPASTTVAAVRLCSDAGATCAAGFSTNKYVEVILENTETTFLGGFAGLSSMTPRARAVAGFATSSDCLVALTGGVTFDVPAGSLDASGCSMAIAGDYHADSSVTVGSVTAASCSAGCGSNIHAPSPKPSDPLAWLPTPTSADCGNGLPGTPVSVTTVNQPITAGTYSSLTFGSPNKSLSMGAGIYCFTGPITASKDAVITGTGVMIYIGPAGHIDLDTNGVDINISAPTSGTFAGIAIYQDRTNSNTATLAKNTGPINLNGALYMPAALVKMKNSNYEDSHFCGVMVVGSLDWNKPDGGLSSTCNDFLGSPLKTVAMAE